MEWHPTEDILLVTRLGSTEADYHQQVTVIDVTSLEILFQIDDTQLNYTLLDYMYSEFLPDGQHFCALFCL